MTEPKTIEAYFRAAFYGPTLGSKAAPGKQLVLPRDRKHWKGFPAIKLGCDDL
jgi:hypothetical protein